MRRFYILVFLFSFLTKPGFTQTIIAIQDFESTPASPVWNYTSSGGASSSINTGTPANSRIRNGILSFQTSNQSGLLSFDAINVSAYNNVKIIVHLTSISGTSSNGADAADHVRLFTSLNGNAYLSNTESNADIAVNGNSNSRWAYTSTGPNTIAGVNLVVAGSAGTNQGTVQSSLTINIPNGTSTVSLRINTLNNDANEIWCLDDIELTGEPASGSSLTITSSLNPFMTVTGSNSAEQSYSVNGSGLTGDITITASSGFEISKTTGTGYTTSLLITQAGGNVSASNIFIRMNAVNPGDHSGTITHSSPGISAQTLSLNGIVLDNEPTTPPSSIIFSNVTSTTMDISFTQGNGGKRVVVMNANSAVTATPRDGSSYSANPVFGSGSTIGTGQYLIYNGTGNSVSVSALNPGTVYHIAIFEYNDTGVPSASNYLSNAATSNQITASSVEGWQITTVDQLHKIDFDNSVTGVNNGQFSGLGFQPVPALGQLSSNSFSFTGWSDGVLNFGGTRTATGTDYTRGQSAGAVSTGGVYAFVTSTGNSSLGLQPGGNDWAPGTMILKIQNKTGMIMQSFELGYKLFVMNDQGRSSTFNFSWSNDNINYTDIPSVNYTSPVAADAIVSWVENSRAILVTGLNVPVNGFFYLRWNSADDGGSGTRDQFAIDDISLKINPASPISLPVKFSDLKLIQKNESIHVQWSNMTESEVEFYTIERSSDGLRFEQLGTIIPKKNDGTRAGYTFIDHRPVKAKAFYRIICSEVNGNMLYSRIAGIHLKASQWRIKLYPNPVVQDHLHIQLAGLKPGKYQVHVLDATGRQVISRLVELNAVVMSFDLDLKGLSPGFYIIRFDGNDTVESKFIRQ